MTIPKDCKRLAEVDFPIAEVSKHAVREKSIRHGHPSTLHLWWARRPLASSRAMLMALLLPDPVDAHCPPAFRTQARAILLAHHGRPAGWDALLSDDVGLRKGLLQFIGDFANWDYAADPHWLKTARALVKAAHPDETPLVVDPFAGGGSIPLEALRVGCDAFASDLNPVAVLINKVMLEDIPRYGKAKIKVRNAEGEEVEADGLAAALRIAGAAVKAAAEKELAEFYPPDPDGSRPIAYLWARTVRCEAPNCGAEIPLVRSFWLAKKANRKRALRYTIKREPGQPPQLQFEVFEPKKDSEVPDGTVSRARATCPCCHIVLPPERVQAQLSAQRGGAETVFDERGRRIGGARMTAVVTLRSEESGRFYRVPEDRDYLPIVAAQSRLKSIEDNRIRSSVEPPGEMLNPIRPSPNARGVSAVTRYGMQTFGDLYSSRQKLTLLTFAQITRSHEEQLVQAPLAFAVSKQADFNSCLSRWANHMEKSVATFGRQALPMLWDWGETVPLSNATGGFLVSIDWIANAIDSISLATLVPGQAVSSDACALPLPDRSSSILFTDPPYYDAIPYADLADFFFVWLKRSIRNESTWAGTEKTIDGLTPKLRECVWNQSYVIDGVGKNPAFFERTIGRAFLEGNRILAEDGIASVVFAHKTTNGWEALLSGLVSGGWIITCSWPLATEKSTRINALDNASLATSVHLVCRPRPDEYLIGDWNDVFQSLPRRVSAWMTRLEAEGVRGADLVFACIGPALELYSQYSQVVDAEDRPIPLGGDPTASEPHRRGYLAYVWETVARLALEQVLGTGGGQGGATGLEEDARLTALFLWTLQSTDGEGERDANAAPDDEDAEEDDDDEDSGAGRKPKGLSLPFDVARRFAQPLGIHLDQWQGRIIAIDKGVVRLLPVSERTRQLFGAEGAEAVAVELERSPLKARDLQLGLFGEAPAPAAPTRSRRRAIVDEELGAAPGSTTLDRVHAAMLLQKTGRTNALRALLAAEQERGPAFLRLANALSGLYPRASEEKRLVDAMLLAYPK